MRSMVLVALLGAISSAALAGQPAPTPVDNGKIPDVSTAERILKSHLDDPYSAHFVWPYEFAQGPFKWPLSRTNPGYFTCGKVNSKNRMGGYDGEHWFFIQVLNDREVLLLIDSESLGYAGAENECRDLIKANRLTQRPSEIHSDPN